MKRSNRFFGFTIIAIIVLLSCNKTDPSLVTITGIITNPIGNEVRFDYPDTSYAATINENGKFEISFSLDSSNYLDFHQGVEVTAMYINPGDKIDLTIDIEQFDETIKYKNSEESSFLAYKYLVNEEKDFYGEPFYLKEIDEYLIYLDDYEKALLEELTKVSNKIFIEKESAKINKLIDYIIGRKENMPELSKEEALFTWQKNIISQKHNFYEAVDTLNKQGFAKALDTYKEEVLVELNKIANHDFIAKEQESLNGTIKFWSNRKEAIDNRPKAGEPAIDFTYPDTSGKEISLSDFKGKFVYVDVWATWCGPCLAEIPYLLKLEKDYHDKNIMFIGVSIDVEEKRQEWLNMIEEKNMLGIQLFADGWKTEITKDYAIFGIPRFMLFDTDGNVINADAPRPSSPEIRELFDQFL